MRINEIVEVVQNTRYAYHVTPVENLSSILQNGLRPTVGTRSAKIKDEQSGIYLFPDLNSVNDAISNWLGDEFDDETELVLLKIDITGLENHISSSVEYELVANRPISPDRISVSSELDLTESASGYIPSNKEKNDPRFKTALTVDIKPDSIQKNAKAMGSKTSRAGIPPQAKTNGKI